MIFIRLMIFTKLMNSWDRFF